MVWEALPLLTLAATKPVQRLSSLLGFAVCGSLAKAESSVENASVGRDYKEEEGEEESPDCR